MITIPGVSILSSTHIHIHKQVTILPKFFLYAHRDVKTITFDTDSELEYIEPFALSGTSIRTITIPKTTKCIHFGAFFDNRKLVSVIIEDDSRLEKVDDFAFASCQQLIKPTLPLTLRYIGRNVFIKNTESVLDSIPISTPSSGHKQPLILNHQHLSPGDLHNQYQHVIIGSDVRYIGDGTFHGWSVLHTVDFSDDSALKTIGDYAFYRTNIDSVLMIPENVTTIGFASFFENTKLPSVHLGPNLQTIGSLSFGYCTFQDVYVPASVDEIGYGAFSANPNLQQITFGREDITGITFHGPFSNTCPSLTILVLHSDTNIYNQLKHLYINGQVDLFTKVIKYGENTVDTHIISNVLSEQILSETYNGIIVTNHVKTELRDFLMEYHDQIIDSNFAKRLVQSVLTILQPFSYMDDVTIIQKVARVILWSTLSRKQPEDDTTTVKYIETIGSVVVCMLLGIPISDDIDTYITIEGTQYIHKIALRTNQNVSIDIQNSNFKKITVDDDILFYLNQQSDSMIVSMMSFNSNNDIDTWKYNEPRKTGSAVYSPLSQDGDVVFVPENSIFLQNRVDGYYIYKTYDGYRIVMKYLSGETKTIDVTSTTYTIHHTATTLFTTFVFGSVLVLPTVSIGESGGDPYVYSVIGYPVKLRNLFGIYRLYQDDHLVINGKVSRATSRIQREICGRIPTDIGIRPVSDGFYFDTYWIGYRHQKDRWIKIDTEEKLVHIPNRETFSIFNMSQPHVSTSSIQYDIMNKNPRVCVTISWNYLQIEISFFNHFQVRNGIRVIHSGGGPWDGLLAYNYIPSIMMVNRIDDMKTVRIPSKKKRIYLKKDIIGHKECWVYTDVRLIDM